MHAHCSVVYFSALIYIDMLLPMFMPMTIAMPRVSAYTHTYMLLVKMISLRAIHFCTLSLLSVDADISDGVSSIAKM